MDFITKIPVSLLGFTLIPIISFMFVMSSLIPIYSPESGFFGVAIALTTNYIWQLLSAAICFITTFAWFFLAGVSLAKHNYRK